ncbi:Serine/threonine-protein kinase [Ceratobasidium sp. AG-Ba]|nr:Serine/threonine-protein kinase [Ceratobasidium sp. AG-Ba]
MSTAAKRPLPHDHDSLPYGSDSETKRRRESDYRDGRDHRRADSRPRDRDRDRDRDRERDRRGGRRERDRDRHGRGERERDRERDRRSSVERRHRDRGRDRSRDRSRDRGYAPRRSRSPKPASPVARDEEREEGEVSPPRPDAPAPPTDAKPSDQPTEPPKQDESEMQLDLAPSPPPLEDLIAQRRARRQAILAKHAAAASNPVVPPSPALSLSGLALGAASNGAPPTPIPVHVVEEVKASLSRRPSDTPEPMSEVAVPERAGSQMTPGSSDGGGGAFSLTKTNGQSAPAIDTSDLPTNNDMQISAAEYDPTSDMREDQARRVAHDVADGIGERNEHGGTDLADPNDEEEDEDLDDMFAVGSRKIKMSLPSKPVIPVPIAAPGAALNMEADDPEGYYQIILGELLDNGKYQVFSTLGKGMFSAVVRARVVEDQREVAIKIIRSQESMFKAGQKEIQILNKLAAADPDDKKHLIRLERTFEHRGHLCLVFESLSMNLRDVIKKFGKDVGLNIRAVRAYAHQLFLGLSLLKKTNIMHADIKPDNILVSENKTVVKICDLGSASDVSENDITPYLVSRFYRAPEIILGLPYDASIDIWSIGCTLYELFTGKILFPGRTNNQMLLHMMELKGRFNTKMIRKAKFGSTHFDDTGAFLSVEKDKITGGDVTRKVMISKPNRDVRARILAANGGKVADEDSKLIMSFIDLLDRCLALDPARRITPKEALMHPFVRN